FIVRLYMCDTCIVCGLQQESMLECASIREGLEVISMKAYDMLVVGAGIYGITTALELKARGYHVAVLDPGPLPHPLAASTDISKVVRMEYGADETYMAMVEQAYQGWLQWNEELGETLFHDVGILILTRAPMSPG